MVRVSLGPGILCMPFPWTVRVASVVSIAMTTVVLCTSCKNGMVSLDMSVLVKPLSQAPKGTETQSAQYCGLCIKTLDADCALF